MSMILNARSHMPAIYHMRPRDSGGSRLLRRVHNPIPPCTCKHRSPASMSASGTFLPPDSKGYKPALGSWGVFTSPVPPGNGFLRRWKWSVDINVETQITPTPYGDFAESKRRTYTYGRRRYSIGGRGAPPHLPGPAGRTRYRQASPVNTRSRSPLAGEIEHSVRVHPQQ